MDSVHPTKQPADPAPAGITALEAVFQADWMNGAAGPPDKYVRNLEGTRREAALLALQSLESELRSQPTVDLSVLDSQAPGQSVVPAPEDFPESLHRYRIQSLLGQGGFGRVYLAYDPELRRHVAIKTLRTDRTFPSETVEDFLDEGRKLARLKHPGIVTVYDVGGTGAACYFVSEFIEGGTLGALMQKTRIPHHEAARIAADVADALHHAHLHGIIHRDIKPGNILMDRQQAAHLSDFGLAITEEEQLAEHARTVGTYAYMSPEQARGESHNLDPRSDLYSLGTVFFQMLTRRLPFLAETKNQYREQIIHRDPRPPRTIDDAIPPELERICLKCLARSVNDRYTTARDLSADLRVFLGHAPTPLQPPSASDSIRRMPPQPAAAPPMRSPATPTPSGDRRVILGISLTAAVAIAIWINVPDRPKKNVTPGPDTPPPNRPAVPTVVLQPVEFDRRRATRCDVDPENPRTVRVTAEDIGLVSLGDHSSGTLDVAVSMTCPFKPTGTAGIFFGLTSPDEPRSDKLVFHSIELEGTAGRESQLVLYRHVPFDGRVPPTRKHGIVAVRNLLIKPGAAIRFRLRIDESGRLKFTANESGFPEFADAFERMYPADPPAFGRFGLFVYLGLRDFSGPVLNDVKQVFAIRNDSSARAE